MSNVVYLNRKLHPLDSVVQDMLECMDDLEWVECLHAIAVLQANLLNKMAGDGDRKLIDATKLMGLVNEQTVNVLESVGWEN